jgi:hypothetical protein
LGLRLWLGRFTRSGFLLSGCRRGRLCRCSLFSLPARLFFGLAAGSLLGLASLALLSGPLLPRDERCVLLRDNVADRVRDGRA